jgi:hypothetical protein
MTASLTEHIAVLSCAEKVEIELKITQNWIATETKQEKFDD